ncbi:hypothetical protein CW701_00545 [Candidatus Bathyarchaeota archaeon]|nr:MAG: hypothetical protein CW701_00545 [Candidatus Bathyarchaeota archaeon]
MRVITLLTDFGLRDSYVAEMKGVILRMARDVIIVDITHEVPKFDVEEGAFHLARCVSHFPEDTIHIGVVDPGVGGSRRGIIIEAEEAIFIGPDNGLLAPAAEKLGVRAVYEIKASELLPERFSEVFHGRDIFAPTAAHIANGVPPSELGVELQGYVRLPSFDVEVEDGQLRARVIHIDGFGNVVLGATDRELELLGVRFGDFVEVEWEDRRLRMPYVRYFSAVGEGEPLLLLDSGGYLELAVNLGDASKRLGLKRGDEVSIRPL